MVPGRERFFHPFPLCPPLATVIRPFLLGVMRCLRSRPLAGSTKRSRGGFRRHCDPADFTFSGPPLRLQSVVLGLLPGRATILLANDGVSIIEIMTRVQRTAKSITHRSWSAPHHNRPGIFLCSVRPPRILQLTRWTRLCDRNTGRPCYTWSGTSSRGARGRCQAHRGRRVSL